MLDEHFSALPSNNPDSDDEIHPAGRHVPQTSGEPYQGRPAWIKAAGSDCSIDNTDIVLWHTFGLTHFPSPEDYPIMPAEPMTVLLRARHFLDRNPALDVPPSFARTPSQVLSKINACECKKDDGSSVLV